MTVHRGRAKAKDMLETLNTIMKGAGYQEISSYPAVEGRVYKTMGENGTSEFYIQLLPVTSHYITVSVHEKYVPNAVNGAAGTFTNSRTTTSIVWSTSSLPEIDVDYIINITKDRVIIFVEGEENDTRSTSGLSYIGLPIRYGAEDTTGNFAGIAAIGGATNIGNNWYALRGRALTMQLAYTYSYYTPTRSFGMGDQLFSSPMVLVHGDEGARGELDDMLIIRIPDGAYETRHKDTFVREGKNYIILGKFWNTNGTLPNAWYAIRI